MNSTLVAIHDTQNNQQKQTKDSINLGTNLASFCI